MVLAARSRLHSDDLVSGRALYGDSRASGPNSNSQMAGESEVSPNGPVRVK